MITSLQSAGLWDRRLVIVFAETVKSLEALLKRLIVISYVNREKQVMVSHEYEMLLQYPDPVWQEQTEALNNVTEIDFFFF